jgi:hypothetical protein
MRRRKYLLVGWINCHYDLFRGIVERLAITNAIVPNVPGSTGTPRRRRQTNRLNIAG